jgi:hypothetical protein
LRERIRAHIWTQINRDRRRAVRLDRIADRRGERIHRPAFQPVTRDNRLAAYLACGE